MPLAGSQCEQASYYSLLLIVIFEIDGLCRFSSDTARDVCVHVHVLHVSLMNQTPVFRCTVFLYIQITRPG